MKTSIGVHPGATRIDLSLAFGATKAPRWPIATGEPANGDRVTHRIEIITPQAIDDEVSRGRKNACTLGA